MRSVTKKRAISAVSAGVCTGIPKAIGEAIGGPVGGFAGAAVGTLARGAVEDTLTDVVEVAETVAVAGIILSRPELRHAYAAKKACEVAQRIPKGPGRWLFCKAVEPLL
ncbi:hypothetical protein [Streptomyces iakyrus]|uniref:hypothetical protein n=1 Tax=Streptomyces iakyrus TaxID=68219 RepID=UPI00368697EF